MNHHTPVSFNQELLPFLHPSSLATPLPWSPCSRHPPRKKHALLLRRHLASTSFLQVRTPACCRGLPRASCEHHWFLPSPHRLVFTIWRCFLPPHCGRYIRHRPHFRDSRLEHWGRFRNWVGRRNCNERENAENFTKLLQIAEEEEQQQEQEEEEEQEEREVIERFRLWTKRRGEGKNPVMPWRDLLALASSKHHANGAFATARGVECQADF